MGLTEEALKDSIIRRLGHPTVVVELTGEQLDEAIDIAKRWLSVDYGLISFRKLNAIPGITEYTLPEDTLDVIKVIFPGSQATPLLFDQEFPFYLPYATSSKVGVSFTYPDGLFSGLALQLQWIDQLRRMFGGEATFEYFPEIFLLRLFPGQRGGPHVIEYLIRNIDTEKLFGEPEELLRRYALAQAKLILGHVRSKYDTLPTAGGDRGMDGKSLIEEATTEIELCKAEAAGRSMPIPFVSG